MSVITPYFRSVKELLQSQSYGIDEYQREYKWEKKQAKAYTQKLPIYATRNSYAVSLSDALYAHQPRLLHFAEGAGLPSQALATFGRQKHGKRLELVDKLVKAVWSPARLKGIG